MIWREAAQFRLALRLYHRCTVRTVQFDNPAIRAAYRRGARDTYESAVERLDATFERALAEWLEQLERWHGGQPPTPPFAWERDSSE